MTSAADRLRALRLLTVETAGAPIELGDLVTVSHVRATNIFRDVREHITNLLGGRMLRYEVLLGAGLETVEERFREVLLERGYDGAVGVRLSHPVVVSGGADFIMYGTGFRWSPPAASRGQPEAANP